MIYLENICKSYGNNKIIDKLSLTIKDNELVSIVGKSGSGKSTLLNIIGQIDNDYSGNLIIEDTYMNKLSITKKEKYIRYNIGYLFQNFALIDKFTVEDNLMIGLEYTNLSKKEKKEKIKEVLLKVKLPNYEKKEVFTLSGGEQQRVALARVMLKPGNIILADEPTGNLDEENGKMVIDLLKELQKEGKTIIIVTHDKAVARQCDRIIKL